MGLVVGWMGVPKSTEWTVRDLLQEELRKRGLLLFLKFLLLRLLGTVADLLKAVIRLGDYKKYSGAWFW